jgi:hypothetical protein
LIKKSVHLCILITLQIAPQCSPSSALFSLDTELNKNPNQCCHAGVQKETSGHGNGFIKINERHCHNPTHNPIHARAETSILAYNPERQYL